MPGSCGNDLFGHLDALDGERFAAGFCPHGIFAFGSNDPVVGREAIEVAVAEIFATVHQLRHRVVKEWSFGQQTICELDVTFDLVKGGPVTLPAVAIWALGAGGLIEEYRFFCDLGPLLVPDGPVWSGSTDPATDCCGCECPFGSGWCGREASGFDADVTGVPADGGAC
jgi:hypothetical protein